MKAFRFVFALAALVLSVACSGSRGLLEVNSSGHLAGPLTSLTLTPANGGDYSIASIDSGLVSLSTIGATTVVTMNVPALSVLIGTACKVTTSIAGVSAAAVTITVDYSGGSTLAATPNLVTGGDGNVAAGTQVKDLYDAADVNVVGGSVADLSILIAGGVDNTPSAGAVRCLATYATLSALD